MKQFTKTRKEARDIRHQRILKRIKRDGIDLPRLIITKSNKNIIAQIFDDQTGKTIVSSSTLNLKLKSNNIQACKEVGKDIATKALAKKITNVVFDRGGNMYHGKIAALADSAREKGLKF